MIYSIRELKKRSQRFLNTWQNMSLKNDAAKQVLFLYQHIKIFWFPPEKIVLQFNDVSRTNLGLLLYLRPFLVQDGFYYTG